VKKNKSKAYSVNCGREPKKISKVMHSLVVNPTKPGPQPKGNCKKTKISSRTEIKVKMS